MASIREARMRMMLLAFFKKHTKMQNKKHNTAEGNATKKIDQAPNPDRPNTISKKMAKEVKDKKKMT